MSLKAYDDACTRAELFGLPKPVKEEFLEKNRHLDVVEFEEVEIKTAEVRTALFLFSRNSQCYFRTYLDYKKQQN